MAVKFLNDTGLGYFWGKIKAWCNSTFAVIAHTHTSYAVKHSYTTTANQAKAWLRIANANTHQMDTSKPLHVQFLLTAWNPDQPADYYEQWFVDCQVFGRSSGLRIFGASGVPFSQARVLYENTNADIDTSDRPAIDIYLNYVLTTACHIEIQEVYNSGWTFLADGVLAASIIPTGFENRAVGVYGSGVASASYCDYATRARLLRSNITSNITLANNDTYRSRVLNCTNAITITVPSLDSDYAWFLIKNFNAASTNKNVTIHPSTTSVLIDDSNADIVLKPGEWVIIASKAVNSYTLIGDGRYKTQYGISKDNSTDSANDLYLPLGGTKQVYYTTSNGSTKLTDVPAAVNTTLESYTIRHLSTSDWVVHQILHNNNGLYYRAGSSANGGTWTNWKTFAFTDSNITGNAATASAVAWSGVTNKPTTIADYGITDAKIANGTITLGSNSITPLTSHQTLPTLSKTDSGSGNAVTAISVSGHAITVTKGSTFLTSHQSLSDLGIGNVKNYDQSKAIKSIARSGTTFTYTCLDDTTGTFTQQDNNTTYTFATGDSDGQIKVTPSGGSAQNVSVKGLKSAAYTESSAYAAASHGTHVTFPSSGTPANIGTASNGTASTVARSDHVHALPDSGVTAGRYTSVNVDAKGIVTAGNVKHSYTTAANAAKNWYRLANASTHQINADTPLHLQFFVRAQASAAGVGYWESWFVDLEVWGQNAGCRVFGNSSAPFSQICVRYENTAASVTTSTAPAVDIYLNYVLTGGTVLEIEEVYNSGWTFVADGTLAVSTVPSGYETRGGIGVNSNGIQYASNAGYADRTQLLRSDITANITLADNDTYRGRVLNVTGTRTVTVPSLNSGWAWFLIKNNNASSGTVTLHPSTTSVLIDNSSSDIVLQPKEYIRIASRAANSYVIIEDGRWMSQKADASHNQASNTITAMTGYSKPSSTSAIGTSDSLNAAIGKLEKALDGKQASGSYALDSNVIHTTGDEYAGGKKTFDEVFIRNGTLDYSNVTTTDNDNEYYAFVDNQSFTYSAVQASVTSDKNRIGFRVQKLGDTSSPIGSGVLLAVLCTSEHPDGYAVAPTYDNPASNSTIIATTAWIRSATGDTTLNSATATKLATARDINISDADGTNTGTAASFDGSAAKTIKLPSTIKASITGNCSGSASKLATARNLTTKLDSTTAVTFDGSANQNAIPVTGTLPVGNGGTGSTTLDGAGIVTKAGTQELTGSKTFNTVRFNANLRNFNGNLSPSVIPTTAINRYFTFCDTDGNYTSSLQERDASDGRSIRLMLQKYGSFSSAIGSAVAVGLHVDAAGTLFSFYPTNNANNTDLGGANNRWNNCYYVTLGSGSSDVRLKRFIASLPEEVLDAWGSIEWVQYKFIDACTKKGEEKARLHSGIIAQDVEKVFESSGLNASDYGFFCHDFWDAKPAEYDENGTVVEKGRDAGDEYSIRYGEALCIEAAYQRRRAERAEARIKALEDRLEALEAKVG